MTMERALRDNPLLSDFMQIQLSILICSLTNETTCYEYAKQWAPKSAIDDFTRRNMITAFANATKATGRCLSKWVNTQRNLDEKTWLESLSTSQSDQNLPKLTCDKVNSYFNFDKSIKELHSLGVLDVAGDIVLGGAQSIISAIAGIGTTSIVASISGPAAPFLAPVSGFAASQATSYCTGELINYIYNSSSVTECKKIFSSDGCPGVWQGPSYSPIFNDLPSCVECAEMLKDKCSQSAAKLNKEHDIIRTTASLITGIHTSVGLAAAQKTVVFLKPSQLTTTPNRFLKFFTFKESSDADSIFEPIWSIAVEPAVELVYKGMEAALKKTTSQPSLAPTPSPSLAPTPSPSLASTPSVSHSSPPTPITSDHGVDLSASIACRQVGWTDSTGNHSSCLYSKPCSSSIFYYEPVNMINFCQHIGYVLNSSRDSDCLLDDDNYCWIKVVVPYKLDGNSAFFYAWTPSGKKTDNVSCAQSNGIGFPDSSFIKTCGSDGNKIFDLSSVDAWLNAPKGNSDVCKSNILGPDDEFASKVAFNLCEDPENKYERDAQCKNETSVGNSLNGDFKTPPNILSLCKALWRPGSVPKRVPIHTGLWGKEIMCRRHSYEVGERGVSTTWESPRPKICSDIESAAKTFHLFLTPGCALHMWCGDEDASMWTLATTQVYLDTLP